MECQPSDWAGVIVILGLVAGAVGIFWAIAFADRERARRRYKEEWL